MSVFAQALNVQQASQMRGTLLWHLTILIVCFRDRCEGRHGWDSGSFLVCFASLWSNYRAVAASLLDHGSCCSGMLTLEKLMRMVCCPVTTTGLNSPAKALTGVQATGLTVRRLLRFPVGHLAHFWVQATRAQLSSGSRK